LRPQRYEFAGRKSKFICDFAAAERPRRSRNGKKGLKMAGRNLRSRRFATVGRSQPNSLSQRFTAPGGSRRNSLSYWACKAGPQPAERPQTKRQRVAGLRCPEAAARAAFKKPLFSKQCQT